MSPLKKKRGKKKEKSNPPYILTDVTSKMENYKGHVFKGLYGD